MKSVNLISILTFLVVLQACISINNSILRNKRQVSESSESSSSSSSSVTKTEEVQKEVLEKPDLGEIWSDLFTTPRTTSCKSEINRKNIITQIMAEKEAESYSSSTILINDAAFSWVKHWGFGSVAYLLDFFDPVFLKEAVAEFKEIYSVSMKEDPENLPEYKDPFDYAAKIATSSPEVQDKLMRELKKFEKNNDPVIYKLSANAVQVYKLFKKANWFRDPGQEDFATEFVSNYDINHDGRLNPKELILGSIIHNKQILGSKKCQYCYEKIARKIGALFTYLDCSETGFVSAEQLWKGLPELKRGVSQFNIFGYRSSENIRSDAINDFILKNSKARDAYVNKEEFVAGILLGIWERQVSESAIIEDDSRNLKKLRWSENNMVDTNAYKYVKDVTKAKIEQEERERYEKWERKKLREAEKAKENYERQQNGTR